jgi:hypothetical protein
VFITDVTIAPNGSIFSRRTIGPAAVYPGVVKVLAPLMRPGTWEVPKFPELTLMFSEACPGAALLTIHRDYTVLTYNILAADGVPELHRLRLWQGMMSLCRMYSEAFGLTFAPAPMPEGPLLASFPLPYLEPDPLLPVAADIETCAAVAYLTPISG